MIGFFKLTSSDFEIQAKLNKINQKIISIDFNRSLHNLYGACNISIPIKENDNLLGFFKDRDPIKITLYTTEQDFNLSINGILFMDGIIYNRAYTSDKTINIIVNDKTRILEDHRITPEKDFTSQTVYNRINEVLTSERMNNLYDKIIYTRNARLKEIDATTTSGWNQTVYDYLTTIMNDTNTILTTLIAKVGFQYKTILYFVDTGSYINNLSSQKQEIFYNTGKKTNVISYNIEIDSSYSFDTISIGSRGGFSLDEATNNTQTFKSNSITRQNIAIASRFMKSNNTLPKIAFTSQLKNDVDNTDMRDFASYSLRKQLNNGFVFSIKVATPYLDFKNKLNGIWTLGKKISIPLQDTMLYKTLNTELPLYTQEIQGRFFIISAYNITYSEGQFDTTLYITPNDYILNK